MISPWRIRFPSVCSPPPRRRPSRHIWACPSLTEARPSAARQKPVGQSVCSPFPVRGKSAAAPPPILECRKMSASDECPPVRRRSEVRRWPVESPPRTNATRTNTRRTPHRTRPNDERTQNEQLTNTHPPARQASRESTRTVA